MSSTRFVSLTSLSLARSYQLKDGWPSAIVGHLAPGATITDRSAVTAGPVDGVLCLVRAARPLSIDLPGLFVVARTGAGSLDTWLDHIVGTDGHDRLTQYRSKAEEVAAKVGTKPSDIGRLNDTIGAILGSRTVTTTSAALQARLAGAPVDPAVFETYFSNYIEGTEFEVGEARKIVDSGNTTFVAPALVEGTLRAGLRIVDDLDTAWERAVLAMFVVAEVHPFEHGNGRAARLAMNDELTTAGQQRIVVPTALRNDYFGGLRRLTRHDDPEVFIKTLRFDQSTTRQQSTGRRSTRPWTTLWPHLRSKTNPV